MLRDNKGKIKNCPSNWAKMTWHQYGWYLGWKQLYYDALCSYTEGIKRLCSGLYFIVKTTVLLPIAVFVRPFLWHKKVVKAKKANG